MENNLDWIKGLPLLLFIAFLIFNTINSTKSENKNKELEFKKKQNTKRELEIKNQEEIDFVSRAKQAALTDYKSAINLLKERYGWDELLETLNLYKINLRLLNEISWETPTKITLPNLDYGNFDPNTISFDKKFNAHEKQVLYKIRTSFSENEWSESKIDDFAQEATVGKLKELVELGCVEVKEPFTSESRKFTCSITKKGEAVLKMDELFRDKKNDHASYIRRKPSNKISSSIASILRTTITQIKD